LARRIGILAGGLAAGLLLSLLFCVGTAHAADVIIGGGQTYTLAGDITLASGDNFTAGDDSGARCTIHGGGHVIYSGQGWTGSLVIKNCDIDGLGAAGGLAINVVIVGTGTATVRGSTFSTSAELQIGAQDQATIYFQNNTIAQDSVVSATVLLSDSQPAIQFQGNSTGTKLFQGNRILRSRVTFSVMTGWLIGGDTPAEGNIITGTRAGIDLGRVDTTQMRNNYIHTTIEGRGWNQVKNLTVTEGFANVIEHNVFYGYNWMIELNGGAELRYNLLLNNIERGWVLVWARVGARVHHNLLLSTKENNGAFPAAGFVVEDGSDTTIPNNLEIFNNTFDANGKCTPGIGGAVLLHGSAITSLRSNAFVGVRTPASMGPAMVHGSQSAVMDPLPPALGYADYNLFNNRDSPVQVSYSTGVDGKTVRKDPGFAYHDAMAGGAVNQQVDPKFALNPMVRGIPFADADIVSGTTTVCQMLAFYRHAYSPASGSPLIMGGDPADGPNNMIGAIGTGSEPLDKFGTLCDPNDMGSPNLAPDMFTCTEVPLEGPGPGPTGTGGTGPTNHGFACVCSIDSGDARSSATAVMFVTGLALALARARPSRKRPPQQSSS